MRSGCGRCDDKQVVGSEEQDGEDEGREGHYKLAPCRCFFSRSRRVAALAAAPPPTPSQPSKPRAPGLSPQAPPCHPESCEDGDVLPEACEYL